MLQYELIRVYKNKLLYISIFIGTLAGLSGLIPFYRSMHAFDGTDINISISCYEAWLHCLSLGRGMVYRFIMPLLVCLPFVDSYLNDFKSRRLNFILLRNSYNKYFHTKIIAVAISATSVVLGILSMWFFIALLLFPHTSLFSAFNPQGPFDHLYQIHPLSYVAVVVCLNVVSGIFYAWIGLGATLFLRNKVFVLCSPLVLYTGQLIISYNLPFSTPILSPLMMITPYESETTSYLSLFSSFLLLAFISIILLFKLKMKDGKEYL